MNCAALLLISFCFIAQIQALTFQVEPREEECFYEPLDQGKQFKMEFDVVRGGLLDIKLRIQDPSGTVLLDKLAYFNRPDDALNEAEGKVELQTGSSGSYSICFDNRMSRWTAKVVSFRLLNDAKPHDDIAKLEHLGPMVDSVIKIADELDEVEKMQHHMRVREQAHFDSSQTTNSRVQWLAVIESVALVSMTVYQLKKIQNWFKDNISSAARV